MILNNYLFDLLIWLILFAFRDHALILAAIFNHAIALHVPFIIFRNTSRRSSDSLNNRKTKH